MTLIAHGIAIVVGFYLQAQTAPLVDVRGVLRDDLRGGAPVDGAEIRLLGTGRSELTGPSGEFTFRAVRPGRIELAHWGPWLDSLQLPPLRVELTAPDSDATVVLATPTYASYHLARCGFSPREGESLVIGDLRTSLSGEEAVVVSASWTELVVSSRQVQREMRATLDSLPARGGGFALCGVPQGEIVTLYAAGAALAGPMLIIPDSRLEVTSLNASSRDGSNRQVRAYGRVVSGAGIPVGGARVELFGDTAVNTSTDERGRFELVLSDHRSQTLLIRSIGSSEARASLHPLADSLFLGDIRLSNIPTSLDAVLVEATYWEREREEFNRRRRGATGYFITEEMLRGIPQVSAATLAAMVPRLGAQSGRGRPTLKLRRGFAFCAPRFFENGIDVGRLDMPEQVPQQWDIIERAKRIEVYTASQAPARFNDNDGCGSIVIWTR